ncbi:MAG: OmpA family protein [Candidatus Omnitrophica bacterium]|nr:OmpA family protein [Candidatus Omnitrophota bacterium]MBI2174352.1 OmpA family protein [Candidatus Omnitrophota bacterium]
MSRWTAGALGLFLIITSGCAITFAKRSPWDIQQLAELSDQLEQFKSLARLKAEEAEQFRLAKELLEQRLTDNEATIGYDERGLVTRMLDQVLFDSGKAQLRQTAYPVLDKVAEVLSQISDQPLGVEGHTDNQPIRYSGWESNKALSIARAQNVVDYLIEERGLDSSRLMAIGYGDERPVASNDSASGRQQNRRVEIVILPQASGKSYEEEAERVRSSSPSSYRK